MDAFNIKKYKTVDNSIAGRETSGHLINYKLNINNFKIALIFCVLYRYCDLFNIYNT